MAAPHSIEISELLKQQLQGASPDLLQQMLASLANATMFAQADQACGDGWSERSDERVNRLNGYRAGEATPLTQSTTRSIKPA